MLIETPRKYVTKRLVGNWEKGGGKKKAVELLQKLHADAKTAEAASPASIALKTVITELILHAIEGHVKEICDVLTTAGLARLSLAQSAFADALWLVNLESLEKTMKTELDKLAMEVVKAKLVPKWMLQERLQGEFIERIGFGSAETLRKKEIRVRSYSLFLQQKYNLLREESEGYAKMLTEIFHFMSTPAEQRPDPSVLTMHAQALIGFFDLDPNRVMDLILEGFEAHVSLGTRSNGSPDLDLKLCRDVCDVLSHFKIKAVTAMVGFKLQFYQKDGKHQYLHEGSNKTIITPTSLLRMAAVLIQYGKIKLEALWPYLNPTDQALVKARSKFVTDRIEQAKKVNKANLNSDERKKSVDNRGTQQNFGKNNQKLEILYQLLLIGDWTNASKILNRLEPIMFASDEGVSQVLCSLISRLIEPTYAQHCKVHRVLGEAMKKPENTGPVEEGEEEEGSVPMTVEEKNAEGKPTENPWEEKAPTELSEVPRTIWPVAKHLGVYLYRDQVLLSKLCRILKEFIMGVKKSKGDELKKKTYTVLTAESEKILTDVIIPAFCVLGASSGLTTELWKCLKEMPYWDRFRIYGYWMEHGYTLTPEMRMQKALSIQSVRQFKKRISASNIRECGRLLVKCGLTNPLVVLEQVVVQISEYDNLIKPVLDSLKFFHPMTFDCLVYVVLFHLSSEKSRLSGGLHLSHWFKNLAVFCGYFFRKYPDSEMLAILQYVVNRLKDYDNLDENCLEVVILRELITHMAGIDAIEELGEIQLEGQAGGVVLQSETATFRQMKNKKKPILFLIELLGDGVALPLMILMEQSKMHTIYKANMKYLELISELFDKTQGVLIQLGEFVTTHIPKLEGFKKMMPPLYDLVHKYHLTPSAAWFIARPVLDQPHVIAPPDSKEDDGKEAMETEEESAKKVKAYRDIGTGPLVKTVKYLLPQDTWLTISPEFYTVFWTLSLYDLYVPEKLYKSQIRRLEDLEKKLSKGPPGEKSSDETKRNKDKEKASRVMERLKVEFNAQKKNHAKVMAHLKANKDKWLANVENKMKTGQAFLQHCILPRAFLTPTDARYCGKFLDVIVSLNTPGFSLIHFYDQLIKGLSSAITSCTSNEASRLGRFYLEMISNLTRAADDKDYYMKECQSKAGYAADFFQKNEKIPHERIVHLLNRWNRLLFKAITHGLMSSSRMVTKNTLYVLVRICDIFPRVVTHAENIIQTLKTISDNPENKNTALAVLSFRCYTTLNADERRKKYKNEATVKRKKTAPAKAKPSPPAPKKEKKGGGDSKKVAKTTSKTSTSPPRSSSKRGSLDPNAKEFKPTSKATSTLTITRKENARKVVNLSSGSTTKKVINLSSSGSSSAAERAALRKAKLAPSDDNNGDDRRSKRRRQDSGVPKRSKSPSSRDRERDQDDRKRDKNRRDSSPRGKSPRDDRPPARRGGRAVIRKARDDDERDEGPPSKKRNPGGRGPRPMRSRR